MSSHKDKGKGKEKRSLSMHSPFGFGGVNDKGIEIDREAKKFKEDTEGVQEVKKDSGPALSEHARAAESRKRREKEKRAALQHRFQEYKDELNKTALFTCTTLTLSCITTVNLMTPQHQAVHVPAGLLDAWDLNVQRKAMLKISELFSCFEDPRLSDWQYAALAEDQMERDGSGDERVAQEMIAGHDGLEEEPRQAVPNREAEHAVGMRRR